MFSCCFTGHRQIASDDFLVLQKRLQKAIKYFIKQDVTDFYAGGALGFDTLAAQAVLKARRFHPQVRLILALPCHDQDARWKEAGTGGFMPQSCKRRIRWFISLSGIQGVACSSGTVIW